MSAYVFVDLDGTLTDSAPGIIGAITHALTALGVPLPARSALRACIGPALRESFPRLGVPPASVAEAEALYRAHYAGGAMFDARVYDGAAEMLAGLRAMGYRLALATAKPQVHAERITAHFGLSSHFDAEFGPELDGTRADKRDLLAHALAATGADAARSFMLGDRLYDARGALANGITPIGALWGFGGREELAGAGVSAFAAAPGDVVGLVEARR